MFIRQFCVFFLLPFLLVSPEKYPSLSENDSDLSISAPDLCFVSLDRQILTEVTGGVITDTAWGEVTEPTSVIGKAANMVLIMVKKKIRDQSAFLNLIAGSHIDKLLDYVIPTFPVMKDLKLDDDHFEALKVGKALYKYIADSGLVQKVEKILKKNYVSRMSEMGIRLGNWNEEIQQDEKLRREKLKRIKPSKRNIEIEEALQEIGESVVQHDARVTSHLSLGRQINTEVKGGVIEETIWGRVTQPTSAFGKAANIVLIISKKLIRENAGFLNSLAGSLVDALLDYVIPTFPAMEGLKMDDDVFNFYTLGKAVTKNILESRLIDFLKGKKTSNRYREAAVKKLTTEEWNHLQIDLARIRKNRSMPGSMSKSLASPEDDFFYMGQSIIEHDSRLSDRKKQTCNT